MTFAEFIYIFFIFNTTYFYSKMSSTLVMRVSHEKNNCKLDPSPHHVWQLHCSSSSFTEISCQLASLQAARDANMLHGYLLNSISHFLNHAYCSDMYTALQYSWLCTLRWAVTTETRHNLVHFITQVHTT